MSIRPGLLSYHKSFSSRIVQDCSSFLSWQFKISSSRLSQKRHAHTNEFPECPAWPTSAHPTPYDIFNTTKDTVDKKLVRDHFYTLAKVYHPDSPLKVGDFTRELKAERFQKIVAAYDILRDEKKRKDYDVYSKGWDYSDKGVKKQNFYGRDFSKSARYNPNGNFTRANTSAGTSWDDFHQDYRDYQKQQDPEFQKKSWERHKKMIVLVTLGSFVVGAIQMKFLMNSASKDIEGQKRISSEAQRRVYMATTNYGFGEAKDDRIKRFLAHREGTTSYDNYGQMRVAQENEKLAINAPRDDTR